ncbi:hypothetical protein [Nocardioides sp. WS12]|uniref:hypothetical protein n=1 Tax=Nocardioides sp. WS12 TaxID=2486272 RepID=UPI0015F97760|nr:hypothetical protein [Nocardioides sp. WS12]
MTVEIVERDVNLSAQQIEEAADSAARVTFKDHLTAVATALSGSTSGPAATSLGTDLDTDLTAWVTAAHTHHTATTDAADDITEADILVRTRIGRPI